MTNIRTPIVIAEIGCNHKGEMSIAKEFIDVARSFCKVNYVKFQKRTPKELLSEHQYSAPHPNPSNSYGSTYGEHREYLEFDLEQHRELKTYCDTHDMVYSTSVWDVTSFKEVVQLKPASIKVPSATNTHYELLELLCREYKGELHISLGMTTKAEETKLIELLRDHDRAKDCVLFHCTSGYPIEPDEAFLLEIPRLIKSYGDIVKDIGYSGHHNGISLDLVAFTLGANYIERHFTLNRTWVGTDHAASLEPDGLRRLARNLEQAGLALQEKSCEIAQIEEPQRQKLKWGVK